MIQILDSDGQVLISLPGNTTVGADLRGVSLCGADLHGINLSNALLQGADLREANLSHSSLSGANLSGASLQEARLNDVNFSYAILKGANFTKARLEDSDLRHAVLQGVDFNGANLSRVQFSVLTWFGIDFRHANLSDTSLKGCLKGNRFEQAKFDYTQIDETFVIENFDSITDWNGLILDDEGLTEAPTVVKDLPGNPNRWPVIITPTHMRVGCKRFSHLEWVNMLDSLIKGLHKDAGMFFDANKDRLKEKMSKWTQM